MRHLLGFPATSFDQRRGKKTKKNKQTLESSSKLSVKTKRQKVPYRRLNQSDARGGDALTIPL